ncbi:tripartite tricarboxylate transporter TctB family protein [Halomonas sp. HP20-15]|uniref:tripartite tricarboxylate transporter TctB family protein n=1 Tax=Halomonas sp. HP20-15 TaxID=3085901 RepID=UPI0029821740|nr:tripartite tricarboxylate transporter TctB family protein [Halomonas sp. HP20-15]MDW5377566.1 tripartite tricarboxylate transporter TctB family protein [Halomonas sp. HP20-15]
MTSKPSFKQSFRRSALSGEFIVPAALSIITLIYLISAIQLGPPMSAGNMTASFFPIATAIVMLIALICAMAHALRDKAKAPTEKTVADIESSDESAPSRQYAGLSPGAIGVIILTAGYLLTFDMIGYFVSTFAYVLLLSGLFGGGFRDKWLTKLLAAIVITIAGYLLFEVAFQVRLPTLWSQ